jgi:hypothetical protein
MPDKATVVAAYRHEAVAACGQRLSGAGFRQRRSKPGL